MMPNINPQMMKRAMKQLGIKQEEINASEVIIKTSGKKLIIRNPNVVKINMGGQESFQISGVIEEEKGISEEDIETVASQAGVSKEKAKASLERNEGDLAKAIIELTEDN
ncbi:nascent polypeptide-associated complex protein [Candidatus Woesearchaeota archaeon]|nr:nascent polypeptide-associated complex protein [Candidatus Woesearchaeota archaeon]